MLGAIAAPVRQRVLRWFARSGLLEAADAQDMLTWEHGGFSLERRLIAFVTAAAPVARILTHLGEPAQPPRIAPAPKPPDLAANPLARCPERG